MQLNLLETNDNDAMMYVEYQPINEDYTETGAVNVPIAALTTSYARIQLYDICCAAGPENILYMDTDSIIVK